MSIRYLLTRKKHKYSHILIQILVTITYKYNKERENKFEKKKRSMGNLTSHCRLKYYKFTRSTNIYRNLDVINNLYFSNNLG